MKKIILILSILSISVFATDTYYKGNNVPDTVWINKTKKFTNIDFVICGHRNGFVKITKFSILEPTDAHLSLLIDLDTNITYTSRDCLGYNNSNIIFTRN